jgi:hypothetical protein
MVGAFLLSEVVEELADGSGDGFDRAIGCLTQEVLPN